MIIPQSEKSIKTSNPFNPNTSRTNETSAIKKISGQVHPIAIFCLIFTSLNNITYF